MILKGYIIVKTIIHKTRMSGVGFPVWWSAAWGWRQGWPSRCCAPHPGYPGGTTPGTPPRSPAPRCSSVGSTQSSDIDYKYIITYRMQKIRSCMTLLPFFCTVLCQYSILSTHSTVQFPSWKPARSYSANFKDNTVLCTETERMTQFTNGVSMDSGPVFPSEQGLLC